MKADKIILSTLVILAVSVQAQEMSEEETVAQASALSAPDTMPASESATPQLMDLPDAIEPALVASDAVVTAPEDVIEAVGAEAVPEGQATIQGGLISLNLKEVELSNVIRLFANLAEANIIIPDLGGEAGVVRKVDVNLRNVEWKPALQSILDTQGLELFEKIPGTAVYSVRNKPADAPEPMNVKTYKLNYAAVTDVSEMIQSMVPAPGKISVFPARNTIVVQSSAANLVEVQEMITAVDLPRQQVFIEAKFMELSDSASEKLGIDWQVLSGYNVGVKDIGGEYKYGRERADTTTRMYDQFGQQYEDVTYEWLENPNNFVPNPNASGPDDAFISTSDLITTFNSPTKQTVVERVMGSTMGATLSAADFNLVLAALKEVGGTKVISNPKIIVANEEMATIHIGQKKPNVRGTTQTAGDSQTTTTYALDAMEPYFTDGIKVEVTPTINTASNITVRIQPTLDRLDVIPFTAPDGTEFYGKSTKTINTLFSLENGQTAAIGGLTQTSNDEVERKVPILGSIPFIGRFFSYSSKVDDQNETIIFVTVGLANPENIDMETGLPDQSSLAMRYDAKSKADKQIKEAELKIYQQHEDERAMQAIQKLQSADSKEVAAE